MNRTKQQQIELDEIERCILIMLFGKEEIPDTTGMMFKLLKINPNDYIESLENKLIPIMQDSGEINGVMLKNMLKLWKPALCDVIEIPEMSFRLSSKIPQIVSAILPGVV